jgi:predicted nucleic acid-binding protein
MATGSVERVFVDTNVLVYSAIQSAPLHEPARRALYDFQTSGAELWISRQVLREYLAVVTRPQSFSLPLPALTAAADARQFAKQFRVAQDDADVTAQLLDLMVHVVVQGRQVHDANIVATMLVNDVPRLLTNNSGDFVRYGDFISVTPLTPPPQGV